MGAGASSRSRADFVISCFERTYRDVLSPGYVAELVESQRFQFSDVIVLINNVDNPLEARELAGHLLVKDRVVTQVLEVSGVLDDALKAVQLTRGSIGRIPHYSDHCLATMVVGDAEWITHWDADARLRQSIDWISPLIDEMDKDQALVVGNPNNSYPGLAEREADEVRGDVAVGYGFSDQVFLMRRGALTGRRPLNRTWRCPASWRYPLAETQPIFEQRVDAWMRTTGRKRATFLPAVYDHGGPVGSQYPSLPLRSRARRKFFHLATPAFQAINHPTTRPF